MLKQGSELGQEVRRMPAWLVLASSIVALAALVVAVLVVVGNARRIHLGPPPVSLRQMPRDTALLSSYQGMHRRLRSVERRITSHRARAGKLTPAQESLARQSDSAVATVRLRLARYDSLSGFESRRAFLDNVKQECNDLRLLVRLFGRSVGSPEDSIDVDSLDAEMKRLISE